VSIGLYPYALAVNSVTNRIYVVNPDDSAVTVIDGATNATTTVAVGQNPNDLAVNPVTNRIYVANCDDNTVTVIDGATSATTLVPAGTGPIAVMVNPVTNKVYVMNGQSDDVTIIDGATNAATSVPAGNYPALAAVNPVTNVVYVANLFGSDVTVMTDAPASDTKVRAAFDRLPGDTTTLARPALTGKGVNRWTPGHTSMMGVLNRIGTTQLPWDWASVTGGSGTDSITWSYEWGTDSLLMGENFVCAVPLEDQAATTNNLGLGSPFAGNLEVYPLYRMTWHAGAEESFKPQASSRKLDPTIVRGVLVLGAVGSKQNTGHRAELLDISGRKVLDLTPGANDVGTLAPGVYFVRQESGVPGRKQHAIRKIVLAR
jgi:YVTN family beta-propeller protein